MFLGILGLFCFVLFDLCVKCFRFKKEGEAGVDLLEIESLGVNQKFVKNMMFFKNREP